MASHLDLLLLGPVHKSRGVCLKPERGGGRNTGKGQERMNVGNKNFKRPSASSSSSSNEYIYKTTKAVIGDDLNSFLAAGNTLNSSRYAAKLHSQHSLLTSKVTEYDHRTEMKSRHVNRTRPLSSVRNSVNIIYDGQKRFQEAMTYRSFPLHTTRLVACTNSTISFVTIPKYTSSSVIAMGNTTNSSPESMDLDRSLLMIILLPLTAVVVIIAVVILLHRYLKKRKLRNRARKLRRNLETNLSWFDAFDLQHTVGNWGIVNDQGDPAEFAIPMGPLCMNNFAFENYNTTLEDNMLDRYSTKSILGRDFSNMKRGSEIHPADQVFRRSFEVEKTRGKAVLQATHVNTGADFEKSSM